MEPKIETPNSDHYEQGFKEGFEKAKAKIIEMLGMWSGSHFCGHVFDHPTWLVSYSLREQIRRMKPDV